MRFKKAVIIYNPNSTGNSEALAIEFRDGLKKLARREDIILQETTHAGHGEELGYNLTKRHKNLLLVSVSGDGGYHELINGVMRAVDEGAPSPICAILPGGNANDHHSYIAKRTLLEAIADDGLITLDLLRVQALKLRYAHSYVGLGLTPLVAVELNKHKLSALKELWLSLKTFWKFKPFLIVEDGKQQSFDSLIMANIGIMAKHLTLDSDSSPRDGKFEIIRWPHGHKVRLLFQLIKSALGIQDSPHSVSIINFKTVDPMPMQLDGELIKLSAGQQVSVSCATGKLRTYR